MKMSVVIPVHNGGVDLRLCLQAIHDSVRKADEVIVVDDGSTDDALACAEAFAFKVVHLPGPPHGPAYTRNRGAKKASGDVIVFVDADVVVHPDTLGSFEQVFREEPGAVAVFGSYDDRPAKLGRVSRFKNLLHHYVHQQGEQEAETFWAGCGAVRREQFLAIAGFSESYGRPSIEDIELGVRLREAGHRVLLRPEIQCTHLKRWTLCSLVRTDVFARAIPWTRLILKQGRMPSGLNTDGKSRLSALLAWLLLMGIVGALVGTLSGGRACALWSAGAVLACGSLISYLNAPLYRFFFRHGDKRFVLTAVALHVFYLLYSSLIFGCMYGWHRLRKFAEAKGVEAPDFIRPFRQKAWVGGAVCLVLFLVYVGDGMPLPGNDATPNVRQAINLLSKGTLTYTPEEHPVLFQWTLLRQGAPHTIRFASWNDQFEGKSARELFQRGIINTPVPFYYLARTSKTGIYANSYGVATGLFALPFVAAAYPFVDSLPQRTRLLWFLCKLAAAFAVAGSAWFLFLIAADHLRWSTAIILVLLYGLATSVFCLSSQTLWQHGPGEFFLAMGTFYLFRRHRDYGPYLTGFAYGLAFLCRPTNGVAVLAGFAFFLLTDRRKCLHYLLGGLPAAIGFFAYNLHYFDRLIVFGQVSALAEKHKNLDASVYWKNSVFTGLAGVLVSPSRGLLVFSPILAFPLWAVVRFWKQRRWLPLRPLLFATLALWLVVASWSGWWGGWSFGYRLVVDSVIFMAFMGIPVAEEIWNRRWLRGVFLPLAIWSFLVQALGTYVYDVKGWNGLAGYTAMMPNQKKQPWFLTSEEAGQFCQQLGCSHRPVVLDIDSNAYRGRLWSLRDNQIMYYLLNIKKSRLMRTILVRQFMGRDG
jgi:hypothetical protein